MKLSLLLTGLGAAAAASTLVVVYVVQKPSADGNSMVPPPVAQTIPTPHYLVAHPSALKEAEQRCHEGSAPSSLYCGNVHKAENLRLAAQYRQGLQSGAPK